MPQVFEIFEFYANFGRSSVMSYQDTIDSFMFMKFCKECKGLLGPALTRTDVDLIFTKAKPKAQRRLSFDHFLDALSAIAERKCASARRAPCVCVCACLCVCVLCVCV